MRTYAAIVAVMLCGSAAAAPAVTRDRQSGAIIAASGLSKKEGCIDVKDAGTVTSVSRFRGAIDGFRFDDGKGDDAYVNVDFSHAPSNLQADLTAWIERALTPGTAIRMGLKVCGTSGRIASLDRLETAPARGAAAASPGRWTYGPHPVLGLTAHVTSGGESFGLACGFSGADLTRTDAVSVRMTSNVAASATSPQGIMLFYDKGVGGGSLSFENAGRYLQRKAQACGLLTQLQKSTRLIVVEGVQKSLEFVSETNSSIATIEQNGEEKRIAGDGDLDRLTKAQEFPLAGSSAAIRRLINACPAIATDLRNDCGT